MFEKWFRKKETAPGLSVLVIDDNPGDVAAMQRILEKHKHRVVTAQGGAPGLQLAKAVHPDVILLDCLMPGLNGIEVCRRLKQDPATRSIPVIFLTAVEDGFNLLKCYEAGADTCLIKPIRARELLSEIEMAMTPQPEDIPPSTT
jgi:CheY-like chemotaxis protein